uniref:Uncharacterized protein n=1 Tax=Candidatus Kentrum eta TaxID=2126337 RepID=A0A450U7P3_9GAMM|nr:MAG: hypothetical protein BECKH772A_GA0070896_100059 [Candidatus Kentron sp. H]VFJ89506.1 MAG: hypothetical protein BECKH772B_GA0070898_100059 [Candidatus Kentron sp. H]VFJ96168.1 MAG: hypothetical protein BECKH772C_GA0070978_100059 [Candidatus Kentron sp. H]
MTAILQGLAQGLTGAHLLWGLLALAFGLWLYRNYKILLSEVTDPDKKARLANDRARLRAGIAERRFEARYLRLLGTFLDRITGFIGDRDALAVPQFRDSWRIPLFGLDPFTEGSYLLCLRLALVYPVAGFFLGWALGGAGALGGMEFLPPMEAAGRRWLLVGGLVLSGGLFFKANRAEGWRRGVYVAVAGAFLAEWLRERCHSRESVTRYWLFFNLFFVAYVWAILAWGLPRVTHEAKLPLLLLPVFLGLLPLANAALDWLSLGVTRGLLYAIRSGHHAGWAALAWAVLDIVLALFFLLAIVTLTTGLLAGLNLATVSWGGGALLDLGALFDGIRAEPWSRDYWWIHFMMLSTLVPTLVHFLIAGFAMALILPDRTRRWLLADFDRRDDARWVAWVYVSFVPPLAFVAPGLFLWGLYRLITAGHGAVGMGLLAWARWVAGWVDPGF